MPAFAVQSLGAGLHRVTQPLPETFGEAGHVHAYVLEDGQAGWTIVDAGLGLPDAARRWEEALATLGADRVGRILLTHFHPDHVGGAAVLAELTGAAVLQTAVDARDARRWTEPEVTIAVVARHLVANGMPEREAVEGSTRVADLGRGMRLPADTSAVADGDHLEATGGRWDVVGVPGHADGAVALLDTGSGRCLAGDALLPEGRTTVGWYGTGRPDPLGDLLASLERLAAPDVATVYPGHGEPVHDVPARAAAVTADHTARLDAHRDALRRGPLDAYRASLEVDRRALGPVGRRFAAVESLAHLRHLEARSEVARCGVAPVLYRLEADG